MQAQLPGAAEAQEGGWGGAPGGGRQSTHHTGQALKTLPTSRSPRTPCAAAHSHPLARPLLHHLWDPLQGQGGRQGVPVRCVQLHTCFNEALGCGFELSQVLGRKIPKHHFVGFFQTHICDVNFRHHKSNWDSTVSLCPHCQLQMAKGTCGVICSPYSKAFIMYCFLEQFFVVYSFISKLCLIMLILTFIGF